jgi:DNA mismatch repair protein MutH
VRDFAFATAKKISSQNFANLTGEIETAIKYAMRRFKGWRWNGKENA